MPDSRVVVIADDPDFIRDLMTAWKADHALSSVVARSTDDLGGIAEGNFDLAVVGPVLNKRLASVLKLVDTGDRPVICVLKDAVELRALKAERPRILALGQHEGWVDAVILLAAECLKRVDLLARLRRTEQAALSTAHGAALGRYMVDIRHDLNNSLTSVLGNAELLLLDGQQLPDSARDQLQTIQEMALHMHQIMQRFSSAETAAIEKVSQAETERLSHVAATAH
ncbi:MAG TPA: histidine kinase dimerization/phospho-acceptor domain-containing protein [Candidatus Angelobacter sp.]|nr:histidine kinase dimerization/phospho-acceptor domain-containing protein [Candidatus Angelobacter sp.]